MSELMPYQIEENGLVFTAPWSQMEWTALGKRIGLEFREALYQATSYCWIIGDWLLEGEKHGLILKRHPRGTTRAARELTAGIGRGGGQGRYLQAAKITGCTESQLSNFYRAAKAFPRETRVRGMSFTMHLRTMPYPREARVALLQHVMKAGVPQRTFLEMVKRRELPPAVLEELPPAARETVPGRRTKAATSNQVIHGITCPHCQGFIDRATIRTIRKRATDEINASPAGTDDGDAPG